MWALCSLPAGVLMAWSQHKLNITRKPFMRAVELIDAAGSQHYSDWENDMKWLWKDWEKKKPRRNRDEGVLEEDWGQVRSPLYNQDAFQQDQLFITWSTLQVQSSPARSLTVLCCHADSANAFICECERLYAQTIATKPELDPTRTGPEPGLTQEAVWDSFLKNKSWKLCEIAPSGGRFQSLCSRGF